MPAPESYSSLTQTIIHGINGITQAERWELFGALRSTYAELCGTRSGPEMQRKRREMGFSQGVVAKQLGWDTNVMVSLEGEKPPPSEEQFDSVIRALAELDERRLKTVFPA